MPAPRTTRNRRHPSSSPSQIDPALHSVGQSPQPLPHPYTLGTLADAGPHDDMHSPPPIADPLTDFARRVIESVHAGNALDDEDDSMFHPVDQDQEREPEPEPEAARSDIEAAVMIANQMQQDEMLSEGEPGHGTEAAPSTRRGRAAQGAASSASTTAAAKRKRNAMEGGLVAEESRDLARMKKDSHKEVERKRRDNINEGIMSIGRYVPGCSEKLGKGQILKLAAQYLAEITGKDGSVAGPSASSRNAEPDKQKLQSDLAEAQAQLTEEHTRSITLETSWREAEDRAAASQFELERVKKELEDAKMALLENRR